MCCAVLITGVGPNGLGATIAESLASQGPALLILTGRSIEKTEVVTRELSSKHPEVCTRTLRLDLSSFESVKEAAAEVNNYTESINVLINNAGVMNVPERTLSVDGFEMQLATNHLGPFLFTNLIMGKLIASKGRIVNIVSNGYLLAPFRFSDYNFEKETLPEDEQPSKATAEAFSVPWGQGYLPHTAYAQSKTAGILYSKQLAKLLGSKGVSVTCVNPGGEQSQASRIGKFN